MSALLAIVRIGRPVSGRLFLAVLAGVGAGGAAVGLSATSAWLISRAAEQPPMFALLLAVTAVRAFGIARGVFRYAERVAAHDAAFRVLAELRATAYGRLAQLAPAGLAECRSGDLLARLVGDVDGLADLWLRVLLPYAAVGIVAVGAVLLVGGLVPAVGVVLAVTLLVTALVAPLVSGAVARRSERSLGPARGALADTALDLLRGAAEITAAGAAPRALAAAGEVDARLAAAERRSALGSGISSLVTGLAGGVAVWLALVLGIAAVQEGSLGVVALAVVVLTPIAIHEVTAPLAGAARQLPGLSGSATRILDILRRPNPVPDPAAPVPVPDGRIGLRTTGLALRYPGATMDALAPLDLVVRAGTRVVVTGPSGAGKSTLAAACLRFLDPARGSLVLVGADAEADVRTLDGDDVRRVVGLCEQDPHIFDASLADNLRLARPGADAAALEAALESAGLLGWVRSLPAGLETAVGEHGARLSGGQRQRLALARAILADVRLLILDEPTEHLDEAAARSFVADLPAATTGRTLLVLTHRPELFEGPRWIRGPEMGLRPIGSTRPATRAGTTVSAKRRFVDVGRS